MTLWALSFLFLHSLILSEWALAQATSEPFWRAKQKIYQRVVEDQEIMVSVSTAAKTSTESALEGLKIVGGGRIATPVEYAFARSMQFQELATAQEYVKQVSYDPNKQILSLSLEAYSHKMNLEMLVKAIDNPPTTRTIEFLVQTGPLKGLKGVLEFKAAEPLGKKPQSEVGLAANFSYEKLPIPALFVRFGLEVILKRMAFRIRQKFEHDFRELKHEGQ